MMMRMMVGFCATKREKQRKKRNDDEAEMI